MKIVKVLFSILLLLWAFFGLYHKLGKYVASQNENQVIGIVISKPNNCNVGGGGSKDLA